MSRFELEKNKHWFHVITYGNNCLHEGWGCCERRTLESATILATSKPHVNWSNPSLLLPSTTPFHLSCEFNSPFELNWIDHDLAIFQLCNWNFDLIFVLFRSIDGRCCVWKWATHWATVNSEVPAAIGKFSWWEWSSRETAAAVP